jgi:hypothetical protein
LSKHLDEAWSCDNRTADLLQADNLAFHNAETGRVNLGGVTN